MSDTSTSALMQRFYELRQSGGTVSKAHALQLAQIEMLQGASVALPVAELRGARVVQLGTKAVEREAFEAPAGAPFAHPFYWAPFVLIGNWL